MRRPVALAALALLLLPALALAIAPGPYYARGDFAAVPGAPGSAVDGTWGYPASQMLYDDGLHDDGVAGDGVYGAWVAATNGAGYHEFKIANADWSFGEPTVSSNPLVNGRLFTSVPGELVHFVLDTNIAAGGWMPDVTVACDHGYPAGMALEVIGSAPELGAWNWGLPADLNGDIWSKTVTIATPGYCEFKFRVVGTWLYSNFGLNYNNNWGYNAYVFTYAPDQDVTFEFDQRTGRVRATPLVPTPTNRTTWGGIKAGYR